MVDDLLRLKLALLASSFRPGSRRLLRSLAVTALVLIVIGGMLVAGTVIDVRDPAERSALVIAAGALSLGILVSPLAAGLGSALEPRRFAAFPVPTGHLALGIAIAGAIGAPGALALSLAIAVETAWSAEAERGIAIAAGVITTLTIILSSQLLVAIAAQLAVSDAAVRAVTALARVIVAIAIAAAALVAIVAARGNDSDAAALVRFADVVARSPGGLTWAAPGAPAGEVAARLGAAGGALIGLAALWWWVVARITVSPQLRTAGGGRGSDAGLGWFDMTPATPGGVIAARSLLYWTRDPRYRVVLLGLPIAPPIIMVALLVAGVPLPLLWLIPLPFLALFLGWFTHNDAAYDHTAIWLHVSAPLRGAADRVGRLVPPLALGVPLIVITAPLFALWSGIDSGFELIAGVSLGLLLTALGVASVVSAWAPYPAARPGAGPFDQPPLTGTRASWAQAGSLIATVSFMSPSLVLAWWGLTADPMWLPSAGLAGVGTGVAILALGVLVGGQVYRRRAPELLTLAQRT